MQEPMIICFPSFSNAALTSKQSLRCMNCFTRTFSRDMSGVIETSGYSSQDRSILLLLPRKRYKGRWSDCLNGCRRSWGKYHPVEFAAQFHKRFLFIHPFKDGNGRTGRLILFRECLKNDIVLIVIEDANRDEYLETLKDYREEKTLSKLICLFEKEQQFYWEKCKYFM